MHDALDFFKLSGCEQLVRCPTRISANRLDLVTTNAPDLVDVVVGTPLGTSDHCFFSCVLRVEQSEPEFNVRSTVFLKHRINWDSVCSAVRRFIWSTILKSADPLVAFDRAVSEVIVGEVTGRYVPATVLSSRSGDKQWFDASCRRAYDAEQTAYRTWCTACNAEHYGQFVLARAEAQWVYGAARVLHNERTRNTLKHSTCSRKWLETLKGSIFGVKPSIPALRRPGGCLVVAPAKKASHMRLSLSGRIGKVVASHTAVARSSPTEAALIYTMHQALRGYCP